MRSSGCPAVVFFRDRVGQRGAEDETHDGEPYNLGNAHPLEQLAAQRRQGDEGASNDEHTQLVVDAKQFMHRSRAPAVKTARSPGKPGLVGLC